jgi:hypothetical protein
VRLDPGRPGQGAGVSALRRALLSKANTTSMCVGARVDSADGPA